MRVLCNLPNMSAQVSGVGFTPAPDGEGWVSDDLTPALAQAFAEIPGYILLADPAPKLEPESIPAPKLEPESIQPLKKASRDGKNQTAD